MKSYKSFFFAALLSCLFLLPISASALRIVDLNTANCDDHANWGNRLIVMAEEIKDANPDIITLQEIRYNPHNPATPDGHDTGQQIIDRLRAIAPDKFAHAEMRTDIGMVYANDAWEGLSIIYRESSNLKFIKDGYFKLTLSNGDPNQRILQYMEFNYNDKPLFIFHTHWSYEKATRELNAKEVLEHIKAIAGNNPVVLIGDLNSTDDYNRRYPTFYSPDVQNMLSAAGLSDLWEHCHDMSKNPGLTYPAGDTQIRIDKAWLSANLIAKQNSIEFFANVPRKNAIYPSDHYGLLVNLE